MEDVTTAEVVDVFNRARAAMRSDPTLTERDVRRFNAAIVKLESEAWTRGWDLAAAREQRESDRWAEMLLQVSAAMRGKDRADGYITTTVYPDPRVYEWKPEA